jgi:hypothetical protein
MRKLQQAQRVLMRSQPPYQIDGFVWLVTAQPEAVARQQ